MSVIDGYTQTVTTTITVGNYPSFAGVNSETNRIYVSNSLSNTVLHQHKMYEEAIKFYLKFLEDESSTEEDRIFIYIRLADCYDQLGDKEKELSCTFKTFLYDIPRPESCCRLGYYFLQKNELSRAIYWYKQAIEAPTPQNRWAIVNGVSRTWLPNMQLGLCYYRLGKYDLSYQHNRIALSYRPDDKDILNNIRLIEALLDQERIQN